jgi:hypothetical protein
LVNSKRLVWIKDVPLVYKHTFHAFYLELLN